MKNVEAPDREDQRIFHAISATNDLQELVMSTSVDIKAKNMWQSQCVYKLNFNKMGFILPE